MHLDYDVDDPTEDNDNLLRCLIVKEGDRLRGCENGLLDGFTGGVFSELHCEAHFSVELYRIFHRGFLQITLAELGPCGIEDGRARRRLATVVHLFGQVRCERRKQDADGLQDGAFAAFLKL